MPTVIFHLLTRTSTRTMIHITNMLTRVASQGPGQSIRISITTLVKPTRMDMRTGALIIITTAIKPVSERVVTRFYQKPSDGGRGRTTLSSRKFGNSMTNGPDQSAPKNRSLHLS
jgi:hypothetical protein